MESGRCIATPDRSGRLLPYSANRLEKTKPNVTANMTALPRKRHFPDAVISRKRLRSPGVAGLRSLIMFLALRGAQHRARALFVRSHLSFRHSRQDITAGRSARSWRDRLGWLETSQEIEDGELPHPRAHGQQHPKSVFAVKGSVVPLTIAVPAP